MRMTGNRPIFNKNRLYVHPIVVVNCIFFYNTIGLKSLIYYLSNSYFFAVLLTHSPKKLIEQNFSAHIIFGRIFSAIAPGAIITPINESWTADVEKKRSLQVTFR